LPIAEKQSAFFVFSGFCGDYSIRWLEQQRIALCGLQVY